METGDTTSSTVAAPLAALAAGVYPAGVLNDVVRYEAKFLKG